MLRGKLHSFQEFNNGVVSEYTMLHCGNKRHHHPSGLETKEDFFFSLRLQSIPFGRWALLTGGPGVPSWWSLVASPEGKSSAGSVFALAVECCGPAVNS